MLGKRLGVALTVKKNVYGLTLAFTLLLSAAAGLMLAVSAAEVAIEDKAVEILRNVAGFYPESSYQISLFLTEDSQYRGLPRTKTTFTVTTPQGNLRANLDFVNGTFQRLYIYGFEELSSTTKLTKINTVESAKYFLQRYQNYDGNAIYGECASMLENVDGKENITKTGKNMQLEVLNFHDIVITYSWSYKDENKVVVKSKNIGLSFERGQLKSFSNNWPLYTIMGAPEISEVEATAIAINASKNYSYNISVKNEPTTITGFKINPQSIVNSKWIKWIYYNLPEPENAREGDPFSLYPTWYVPLGFDKLYPGGITGLHVYVWADTGQVVIISPMYARIGPGYSEEDSTQPSVIPVVNILSPQSKNYTSSKIELRFAVDRNVYWISYSLDGQENVTLTSNTVLTNLTKGWHYIVMYATDSSGRTGYEVTAFAISSATSFTVTLTTLILAASGVSLAVVGAGLLVYFKKRKR
jgi:hypothetical protein